ncbi:DUF6745 domain-containing protein [Microlunatus sp. GCM10028923]|uniref:DUF6745 domain-containing protein n=1 Tax=Microlunatus sp. GCM10028923 TaxID=3273400 RepID=UPI003616C346
MAHVGRAVERLSRDEELARVRAFGRDWIERNQRPGSLTEAEWATWEAGARACYGYADVPWPSVVVRVGSPMVGEIAAPAAQAAIRLLRTGTVTIMADDDRLNLLITDAVNVIGRVFDAAEFALYQELEWSLQGRVDGDGSSAVGSVTREIVLGYERETAAGVSRAWAEAYAKLRTQLPDETEASREAEREAARRVVSDAARGAVHTVVRRAVPEATPADLDDAVHASLTRSLQWGGNASAPTWLPGRFGARAAQGIVAYFRDVVQLRLGRSAWTRSRAHEDASSAGPWWPYRDFVMVSDPPTEVHLEPLSEGGWRPAERLHNGTGPAIRWPNGDGLHFWHGVPVPADLVEAGWSVDRILAEPNAEVRRCAIERQGWDWFIERARLTRVGEPVADPANPGQTLSLYELPGDDFAEPSRVLLCTNATVERDGTRRRYGLVVPASVDDPVSAAAWTFGLTEAEYRTLQRAT